MKLNILLKMLFLVTLGLSFSFAANSNYNEKTEPLKKSYSKLSKYKQYIYLERLKYINKLKYQEEQLKLQEKKIDTQIKILKKNLQTVTTSNKKDLEESVTQFSISPKIIIKTINYDLIIKRPIYKGLLLFYKSKNLFQQSQNNAFFKFQKNIY